MRNLNVDDLIKIANQEPTTEANSKYTLEERFFIEFGIEPSETERVDLNLVYWKYVQWCIENKFEYKPTRVFGKEASRRFKRYNARGRKQYYINNPEQFALSQDELWQMRKFFRTKKDYQDRAKKGQEKKKQRQASRTNEEV